MKRERIMIIGLVLLLAAATLFYWRSRYPSMDGQSLNEWIEDYKEALYTSGNPGPYHRGADFAGLQTWRDHNKRGAWATRPRTRLYARQRRSTAFNLKSMTVNLITQSGRANMHLARTLIENLTEPDPQVRELSAAMLAGFPSEASIIRTALENALNGDHESVCRAARKAMDQLGVAVIDRSIDQPMR